VESERSDNDHHPKPFWKSILVAAKTDDQQTGKKIKIEPIGRYEQPERTGHDVKTNNSERTRPAEPNFLDHHLLMPVQMAIDVDRQRQFGDVRREMFYPHIHRRIDPAETLGADPRPVDRLQ
jgi:hypothetical protein